MVTIQMDRSVKTVTAPSPMQQDALTKFSIESLLNGRKKDTSPVSVPATTPPAVATETPIPTSSYPVSVPAMMPPRMDVPHGSTVGSHGLGFLPLFGRTPDRNQPLMTSMPPWIAYGGLSFEQSVLFAQTGKYRFIS